MCRNPICSKQCFNKGSWSSTEDSILANYVRAHGEGRWTKVPKRAGLNRCPRSCRLRWLNYLRPDIKRGNISHEEEDLIIRLHNLLGNRWSLIAGRLPGRTDNEIKNYWNTVLKKRNIQSVKPAVVSIIRSCKEEDVQSQEQMRFPAFESSSSILNKASAINQTDDTCKDDASFDLFSPLIGSEKEDLFEEDMTTRVDVDLPVSFGYEPSMGREASDDWVGWESIQPCGGVSVGSLAAFWQCETECLSLWADIV